MVRTADLRCAPVPLVGGGQLFRRFPAALPTFDPRPFFCNFCTMKATLDKVALQAIALPPRQRLALAGFLLEVDSGPAMPDVDGAWETEIEARIQAVDTGKVKGVPFSEVMRQAAARLVP